MKDKILDGFAFSHRTEDGREHMVMASFGTSKSKAKRNFNQQNQQKLGPIQPYKRYAVQVIVLDEAPKEANEDKELK